MMDYSSPGRWEAFRPHVLSAVACLPLLSAGISIGYPATTLPQLRTVTSNTTLVVDTETATWFSSALAAAAPVGGLLAVALLDRLGRKALLLGCCVPALLGWLLIARAPYTTMPLVELYTARALAGLALGAAVVACPVYLAEVVAPRSAQPLTCWPGIALALGLLAAYALGATLPWDTAAYAAAAAPCLAALVVARALPDSPAWLRAHRRPGDADWALRKLRLPAPPPSAPPPPCPGCSADARKKHDNCLFCAERFQDPSTSSAAEPDDPCKTALQVLFTKHVLKNFAIQVVLVLFQQFSGVFAILPYVVDVVQGLNLAELGPYNVAVVCGALVLVSSVCIGVLESRFGMRNIAILCNAGMALSMLFLSFHLTLLHVGGGMAVLYYEWIPFVSMLFFVFFGAAWLVVFPWLEFGEKFPLSVRGTVGYILFLLKFAALFVNLKYFPQFTAHFMFEMTEVWYYLCLTSTMSSVFVFFFWPKSQYSLVGIMGDIVVTPMHVIIPEEERLLRTDSMSST